MLQPHRSTDIMPHIEAKTNLEEAIFERKPNAHSSFPQNYIPPTPAYPHVTKYEQAIRDSFNRRAVDPVSGANLNMPGAFDARQSFPFAECSRSAVAGPSTIRIAPAYTPTAGRVEAPIGQEVWFMDPTNEPPFAYPDEETYGYEYNRPRNLSAFFTEALQDFHEDNDVAKAATELSLADMSDVLNGMRISLMPHQILGVAWMVKREKLTRKAGGILGDEMGLGKTVQAIATMVRNPSQDRAVKTTLIVMPLPLLSQWKDEIETKSGLKVHVYHGANRTKSIPKLKSYDVVLTTYGVLIGECGKLLEEKRERRKKRNVAAGTQLEDSFVEESDSDNAVSRANGPLFRIQWYRMILDEAAGIRNRLTKASKAVVELEGHIRWVLTGVYLSGACVIGSSCRNADIQPSFGCVPVSPVPWRMRVG